MSPADQLLFPRWLVPVRPAGLVLENQCVAVSGEHILDVLPASEAIERWPDAHQVHLPDHVLTPGLINAHAHSAMSLLRGYADDLRLEVWLQEHIWPAESKWVSNEFVRDGSQLAILEMLRGGITCFNDMYFCPGETADVAINAGIRASLGMVVIDVPTAFGNSAEEYIEQGFAFHEKWSGHALITSTVAPHSAFSLNDEQFGRVVGMAESLDTRIHMHVHETAWEIEDSIRNHGVRPIERLSRLGLLSPRLMAVHMTQLTDNELQAVADCGAHIVHCPESNLKLASGMCPVAAIQEAGVNVCVGTDGAASNNDLDLLGEVKTAALLAKCVSSDPQTLNAQVALEMITINAARALGMETSIGTIEPGKQADLCAIDLSYPETQPVHHVVSQIIYAAGRNQVSDVWVAGKRVMESRDVRTMDEVDILARAANWQRKLQQSASA